MRRLIILATKSDSWKKGLCSFCWFIFFPSCCCLAGLFSQISVRPKELIFFGGIQNDGSYPEEFSFFGGVKNLIPLARQHYHPLTGERFVVVPITDNP
jgi:hypothetical protein